MKRALHCSLLTLLACGAPTAPPRAAEPVEEPPLDVDVRPAVAVYRAHLAAWGIDGAGYYGGFADTLSCYEGREELATETLRAEASHLHEIVVPLGLVAEPISERAVQIRAWIYRRLRPNEARIEPRVVRLHHAEGRWRITSAIGWEQTCGFDRGLSQMSPPAWVEACLQDAGPRCGFGPIAAIPSEERAAERRSRAQCEARAAGRCLMRQVERPSARSRPMSLMEAVAGSCSDDGWCVVHPTAGPGPVFSIAVSADGAVYAAGAHGLSRFDGSAWQHVEELGRGGAHRVIAHRESLVALAGSRLFERDPARGWYEAWNIEAPGFWLNDVYLREADAWAVGARGLVLRRGPSGWERQARFVRSELWGLFEDPRYGLVAYGASARPWRFHEGYWEPIEDFGLEVLRTVRATDGLRLVARPTGGRHRDAALYRLDGERWVRELELPAAPYEVSRTPDGWLSVDHEAVHLHRGGRWEAVTPGPGLRAISARFAGGALFVGGDSGVRVRHGARWDRPAALTGSAFHAVAGRGPDDVWFLAENVVLHWDGARLEDRTPEGLALPRSLAVTARAVVVEGPEATHAWGASGWTRLAHDWRGEVVARGEEILAGSEEEGRLVIRRWTGQAWEISFEAPAEEGSVLDTVVAVRGPRSALVLVRDRGPHPRRTVLYDRGRARTLSWDGEVHAAYRAPTEASVLGGEFVSLVRSRLLARVQGRRWVRSELPERRGTIVAGRSSSDFYTRYAGSFFHYSAGQWTEERMPEDVSVRALWLGESEAWAAGEGGVILRRQLPP